MEEICRCRVHQGWQEEIWDPKTVADLLKCIPRLLSIFCFCGSGLGRAVSLRVGERVPVADLLALRLSHLRPVGLLLLARAAVAQGDPAQPLPGLHAAAPAEHRHHQRHLGQLEERHLEDEGLLVAGVGLAAAHGRLALGHLFALGVQHGELHVGVWEGGRRREAAPPSGET